MKALMVVPVTIRAPVKGNWVYEQGKIAGLGTGKEWIRPQRGASGSTNCEWMASGKYRSDTQHETASRPPT
jgi:hypothetical protein